MEWGGGAVDPATGTYVVNSSTGATGSLDNLVMTGGGTLRLAGTDTLTLSTQNLIYVGTTVVENGELVLTGEIGGDLVTTGALATAAVRVAKAYLG